MPYFDGLASMIYGSLPRYRVGLEDLYQPSPEAAYPAAPDWIDSVRDLPGEQRRALRQQAILQAAFAIGRGGQTGEIGTALAGAALQGQDEQARMIAQARSQQEHDYARARDEAEFKQRQDAQHVAEAAKKEQAQALLGLYQRVVDADPALADQAEIAVRQGDMSTLGKLYGQEIPRRQWFREHGMDPDDPVGAERLKQQLEIEEAGKKREADDKARLAYEEELRKRGLGTYYQDPLERERLDLMRSRGVDGNGNPRDPQWKPNLLNIGGKQYMVDMDTIDPETGQPAIVPLDLPPSVRYNIVQDRLGQAYAIDPFDPSKPPVKVPLDPFGGGVKASPAPTPAPTSAPPAPRNPAPPPKKNPLRKSSPAVEKNMETVAKSIGGFQTAAQREQVRRDLEAGVSLQTVLERIRKARAGQ